MYTITLTTHRKCHCIAGITISDLNDQTGDGADTELFTVGRSDYSHCLKSDTYKVDQAVYELFKFGRYGVVMFHATALLKGKFGHKL